MGKYFGTDGIRGKYGEKLDETLAYKTGLALGEIYGGGTFVVGRDTRVSGEELETALVKGLTDMGGEVMLPGIVPTPAVAMLAKKHGAACGIMISASHNPPEYNGIKVFDGNGVKYSEEQEGSVEYYIDNPPAIKGGGKVYSGGNGRAEYIDYVVSAVNADFRGLKVWLDCGYGAASTVAEEAFRRLGATVMVDNCKLRGEKINSGCGALHPDYVRNSMKGSDCRLGFAFDGDADRLSVVMDGEIIDGDTVLYNIAKGMDIKDGVVVGTILNNLALENKLRENGRRLVRTPVGDKYICDLMFRKGYNIGGEQSGHIIFSKYASTGDGILTSLKMMEVMLAKKKPISELAAPLKIYPQVLENVRVTDKKAAQNDEAVQAAVKKVSEELGDTGRILVRESGTEPVVRVMVEAPDHDTCQKYVSEVVDVIRDRGYSL